MRKEYKTPETSLVEMRTEAMLAVSPGIGEDKEYGTTDASGYRGDWGNLWN